MLKKQSEYFVGEILEKIQDPFFSLDREWCFTYLDPKFLNIAKRKYEDLIGKKLWEEFPYFLGTELETSFHITMEKQIYQRLKFKSKYTGNLYNITVHPAFDGISAYMQIITEKDDTVETLKMSEELIDSLVKTNTIAAVWETSAKGRVVKDSPTWRAFTGQSREEFLSEDGWIKAVHPDDAEYALNKWRNAIKSGANHNCDYRIKSADGNWRWTTVLGTPIRDGKAKIVRWIGMHIDITKSKEAEEVLAFQSNLLESVYDAIIATDRNNNITYWNSISEHMFNSTAEEIIGKNLYELFNLKFINSTSKQINQILDEIGYYTGEAILLNEMGKEVYISSHSKVLKNNKHEIIGYIHSLRDISENKKAEKVSYELLKKLKESNENKAQFIGMLSHEIRNPMASIMMSIDLLDRIPPETDKAKKVRNIIKHQATQLSHLLDDLLDITRIDRNKIDLKKENLELNDLVHRVVEDFRPQFDEEGVKLIFEPNAEPIFLKADPIRITQVLGNLLNNAIKFTKEGDSAFIAIALDKASGDAVIKVMDNGIGIRPDALPKIFDPFVQAENSLDRTGGGLGLGLAVVKGMVELHGGNVVAYSEGLGKGSEFTIRLPIIKGNNSEEGQLFHSSSADSKSHKVLLIDDNKELNLIMSEVITFLGHEPILASNGPEGIAKAKEYHPKVIICDIGMPGMDGYEVARRIRDDNQIRDTFLIAISGYAQKYDLDRSNLAGFDKHLAKPVDLETLKKILSEVSFADYVPKLV